MTALDVQFEDYTTHNSALKVCGVHILKPVFDQQVSRTEEEPEDEEDKATLLDTLKGLEAARKHMYKQNISSSRSPWLGYNCIIIKKMGIEHINVPSVFTKPALIYSICILYIMNT